jgi:hypothetical protein
MGSANFITKSFAKTPEEAFRSAVQQARWEHGHGGYTGTIAEKSGYTIFPRPERVKAADVIRAVQYAAYSQGYSGYPDPTGQEYEEAWRKLVTWYGPVQARRIIETHDNKWSNCIAITASEAETKAYKEAYKVGQTTVYTTKGAETVKRRVHGTLYIFAGYAPY